MSILERVNLHIKISKRHHMHIYHIYSFIFNLWMIKKNVQSICLVPQYTLQLLHTLALLYL